MAARQSAALSVNPRYTTLVTLPRAADLPPPSSLPVFNVTDLPLPRNRPRIHPLFPLLPSQLCTPLMRDGARTARNRAAN